jgi:hypothetical protein
MLEPSNVNYEEIYENNKLDFLVVGDWGYQAKIGNQKNVAFVMKKWAERYNSQFMINVGGELLFLNFYGKFIYS